jgi:AraC-like DNA-binding protein
MTTPLISTRTMVGLGDAIEAEIGCSALQAAMHMAGLPDISLFTQRAYLPHLGQLVFLEAVARRTERNLAWILKNNLRVSEYGAFGAYVTGGKTFGAALARTVAGMPWHPSHDRIFLARHGDVMRLTYSSHVRDAPGYRQYAPLAACVLLSIARPYCGRDATARLIRIDAPREGASSDWERFFGCEVRFDCENLSLDFDVDKLSLPRLVGPSPAATTIEDVAREASRSAPRDLVGVAEQLIRLAVLDGVVHLDSIAEQLRLGPRTFRRRLEAEGVSFRDLVKRHRIERASELLGDGTFSVRNVALAVGYSDAAHFVRAFKRETGRTPRELFNRT